MENYLKVKDYPEFVRDKKSNAILNIDSVSLNKYKEERNKLININKVIKEHEKMKNDISDIKSMLLKLMESK
jgi:hypothetical protein